MILFERLLKKINIPKEYLKELKIIYVDKSLEIINYPLLVEITKSKVSFVNLYVFGQNLKVVYQDKVLIKITGEITKITKKEEKDEL